MKKILSKKGQLLVEMVIGIGTLSLMLAAIVPLFLVGVKAGSEGQIRQTAQMLAQSAFEGLQAIKNENWNNIYRLEKDQAGLSGSYHLEASSGKWILSAGEGTKMINGTTFKNKIILSDVSRSISAAGTPAWQYGEIEAVYDKTKQDPSTQKATVTVSWENSAGISYEKYFTRFENQVSEETNWAGQMGTQIDTATGGLRLAKIPSSDPQPYGNQFIFSTATTLGTLNRPQYRVSMRFTAQNTGQLGELRVYLASATVNASGTYYRYGIQADNNGLPDGNYIGYGDANFNKAGWQSVNMSVGPNLVAGRVYHLVIQYISGTNPTNNRNITIRVSTPLNKLIPQLMTQDSTANTLSFNGTSWTLAGQQPIYLLGYSNSIFEGNPYDTTESRSVYGAFYEAEKFTVKEDKKISGVGIYVAKSNKNQNPSDSLKVLLEDLTDQKTIADEDFISDPSTLTTSFSWETHDFSDVYSLAKDHQYRLTFYSSGSNSNQNYLVKAISSPSDQNFIATTWDGVNSFTTRSTNSGTSWTDIINVDLTYYLLLFGEVYAPSGELVSKTFDTGNAQGGGFNRLSWCARSLADVPCDINPGGVIPLGSLVRYQIATNNDNSTWNFFGPSGGATDYYTLNEGENFSPSLSINQNRYLRYKIYLVRGTDPTNTPIVDWIRINWAK